MTPEQENAIIDLRSRSLAPKQIARQLGLRPAEVSSFLKAQAEQTAATKAASGELDPLHQCLVNKNCLPGLRGEVIATSDEDSSKDEDDAPGMAVVMVSRKAGFNKITVCTYLVDLWCLGVKDASGPRQVDPVMYRDFVAYAYDPFPEGTEEISLEMAQAIVFGGIEYAAKLGFQPHRDFEQARSQLGEWSGEPKLTFGRNGKPCYFQGPYDDDLKIMRTLRQNVGEGNFDYVLAIDMDR